jgi:hypothetical protein
MLPGALSRQHGDDPITAMSKQHHSTPRLPWRIMEQEELTLPRMPPVAEKHGTRWKGAPPQRPAEYRNESSRPFREC